MGERSLKPGHEKFTVILDLKGLKYKNLDPRGWISIFDFLQAYYPERLGRLFIVHVPIIFWGAWKIVNPFIDKVTKEKVNLTFIKNRSYQCLVTSTFIWWCMTCLKDDIMGFHVEPKP
jgi:hypothetical protein